MTETILLECIKDNPYQPRLTDDLGHIERLARSIAADGLLQVPTARHTLGGAELAFGHSRRKAFEWLRLNFEAEALPPRYNAYSEMPLNIEDLSDEEMYRYAVTENVQRKDLDPVEQARAMARYRDEFGKTSKEIGDLFGMGDATVRGKVRLLDLPDSLQAKLSSAEISESTARLMLSMQKLCSEQDLLDAVEEASEDQTQTQAESVRTYIYRLDNVEEMWDEANKKGKPRGHLWRESWDLETKKFPNHLLPDLSVVELAGAIGLEKDSREYALLTKWIIDGEGSLEAAQVGREQVEELIAAGMPERLAVRVGQLINPVGCNICPFYAKVEKIHYCGFKPCHSRKLDAWKEHLAVNMSKRLGIPFYAEGDGKYRLLSTYQDEDAKLFRDRSADLRILPKHAFKGHAYQYIDGFEGELGWLVVVGETAKAAAQARKQQEQTKAAIKDMWEIRDDLFDEARGVLQAEVGKSLEQLFEAFNLEAVNTLLQAVEDWEDGEMRGLVKDRENGISAVCLAMARSLDVTILEGADDENRMTVQQYAQAMAEKCKKLGVKMPKGFLAQAAGWDAKITAAVAVETEPA